MRLPLKKHRLLPAARLLLAVLALLLEVLRAPSNPGAFVLVFGSYAAYSLILFARKSARGGVFALLAFFADAVYFLILSNHFDGAALWLAAVFFLYLIGSAVAEHNPREVAVIMGLSILFFLVAPSRVGPLRMAVIVGGVSAAAFAFHRERLAKTVFALQREMTEVKTAASNAREEERHRIAADFHDGPLQSFISFQMRLEILRKIFERDPKSGVEELVQLQALAKNQITEIRTFVRSMRPLNVDGADLTASVRRIADDFQKETGIPVTFVGGEAQLPIAPDANSDILQMVREALHNIQKHAGATRVAVAMERVGKHLEISIDDNGHGFQFSGVYALDELDLLRLGPVSLKQRARSLSADLILESRPGRGAGVRLRIPI